jgi:glycosyl transferase family 25
MNIAIRRMVINLEIRADRRIEMERQLASVGWTAEFVNGIRPEDRGDFPSIGAKGCFLSHLEVLKRGAGSTIILMEDDLDFAPEFAQRWDRLFSELPDDWSIFYPASDVAGWPLSNTTGIMRSHMMVFRSTIVDRMISELEMILSRPAGHILGGPMHVDGAYSTIRKQNADIMTYSLFPPLGSQRSSRSDIADLRFFDRLPILRPLAGLARKVQRSLGNLR